MVNVSSQFRLVGRSYVLFALVPEFPLSEWLFGLDDWLARSPDFFARRPVLLDLSNLSPSRAQISGLVDELKERGIALVALEGVEPELHDPALPPLIHRSHADEAQAVGEDTAPSDAAAEPTSLLLDKSVRSGESVVFANGDVTVLGSVSSGAEIIAGGSIHVYGTLRGRALAGMSGNAQARVFCAKFDAELVAIDGLYATANDAMAQLAGRPVQAWREQDSLQMREIISSARRRV